MHIGAERWKFTVGQMRQMLKNCEAPFVDFLLVYVETTTSFRQLIAQSCDSTLHYDTAFTFFSYKCPFCPQKPLLYTSCWIGRQSKTYYLKVLATFLGYPTNICNLLTDSRTPDFIVGIQLGKLKAETLVVITVK